MPVQLGDVVSAAKFAWRVYEYGFSKDNSASKHYKEFGDDVRHLATQLDVLERIIHRANTSLKSRNGPNARARWDPTSLYEIVGNYNQTLAECNQIVQSNMRYRNPSNPLGNLEWNVLVHPKVNQLRQRMQMHNSKLEMVLKPFEFDLLHRIHEDIRAMHEDLGRRMDDIREDVRLLIGILVPNLEYELKQQAQRRIRLLDVPETIARRFMLAATAGRPAIGFGLEFGLEDLSEAFVLSFQKGTINFRGGSLVPDRIPPAEQYLNLLKSVWILERIKEAPTLQSSRPESHWPSFVREMETRLSYECQRFGDELLEPTLDVAEMPEDFVSIWPETPVLPLIDIAIQEEMMERLLVMPLSTMNPNAEQKLQLLRRSKLGENKYRLIISAREINPTGRPPIETKAINFDLSTVVLSPQYPMRTMYGPAKEIVLKNDETIARLTFVKWSDIFAFQQALTGYKVFGAYKEQCVAKFVVSGQKAAIEEAACIQLWIPKQTTGSSITSSAAMSEASQPSRASLAPSPSFSSTTTLPASYSSMGFNGGAPYHDPMASSQRKSVAPASVPAPWQRLATPEPPGPSGSEWPGRFNPELSRLPPTPTPEPFNQPPTNHRLSAWNVPMSPTTMPNGRSYSVSSKVSFPASSSEGESIISNTHSVAVSTGGKGTGLLHQRPTKPMLVIFSENARGQLSLVSIKLDAETQITPKLCECRRSGREGMACPLSVIERKKGKDKLVARRYEASQMDGQQDWNIARLSAKHPDSANNGTLWSKLERVTLEFPSSQKRQEFAGARHECRCGKIRTEKDMAACLDQGHGGLWGEVQNWYRREMIDYNSAIRSQRHVVVDG